MYSSNNMLEMKFEAFNPRLPQTTKIRGTRRNKMPTDNLISQIILKFRRIWFSKSAKFIIGTQKCSSVIRIHALGFSTTRDKSLKRSNECLTIQTSNKL